jgi:probable phosphoglycerate mutase
LQGEGDVALFAHGHILRMIAACWLNVPPSAGASLALTTASVSRLGYERENRVIALSNFAP